VTTGTTGTMGGMSEYTDHVKDLATRLDRAKEYL
jgi:hypothetical protein